MRNLIQRAGAVLGLWAIASWPAIAGPYAEPLARALHWLEARQDAATGSWRGNAAAATMLQTTAAVRALDLGGRRTAAWQAGQAWLGNHEATNTDTRARRLRAMRTGMANLQSELDVLLRERNGNGWGLAARYQRDPLDSALALSALWHTGSAVDLREVVDWLRGLLAEDASWTASAGAATPGFTAIILEAVSPAATTHAGLGSVLRARLTALAPAQLSGASVGVRALASLAWQALLPGATEGRQLLAGLREAQAPDGGIENSVLATALVAQALARAEAPVLALAGERVAIGDLALRLAINETLGRGALDELTRGDLAHLTSLNLDGRGVRSVRGLEYATNLQTFTAGDSPIDDLSPLSGLPGLALRRQPTAEPGTPSPTGELNTASEAMPRAVPLLPAPAGWLLLPLGLCLLRRRLQSWARGPLLVAGLAAAVQVPAATLPGDAPRALPPGVLDEVRTLSHRLLRASTNTPDVTDDRAVLEATQALVAELEDTTARAQRVTVQARPTRSAAAWSPLPPATVERTRALIARLRQPPATATRGVAAVGLSQLLAVQRAGLFQRWATDLEASLAPEAPDRLARLSALRRRLQADERQARRRSPGTPTLQALPAPAR